MSTDNDKPPHQDAPAAYFVEGDEPTYALIGEILHITDGSNATTCNLLVGQGITRPIDEEILPLFKFFATPRFKHQADDWLEWSGAPAGVLSQLVKLGYLVRVDTRTPSLAAKSLRGLQISPQATPGEPQENGYIALMSQRSEKQVMSVSPELAVVLWGNDKGYDIPSAVKAIAKTTGEKRDLVALKILTAAPMMLRHGYARLEWLRVPKL